MTALTVGQIFGSEAELYLDQTEDQAFLTVNLEAFQNVGSGSGQILNGRGIDNVYGLTNNDATKLFYALILLISQNQATGINDDPTQKIYISDGGKRFATGTRDGQIQRVISVNLFSDANLAGLPDIDDVGRPTGAPRGNTQA